MSPTRKKTVTRRRPRAKPAASPPPPEETRVVVATPVTPPAPEESPLPAEIVSSPPERDFAGRVPPPPERPWPNTRRAIFFDVENTSQVSHIARVIDHLRVDRIGQRTDFLAVGNWRVIGHDTARLLARHGAQLIHSAPSVGVRDWSDLRIAVGAGVWLASARPGDVIEIISDDRAFDAVGDVAASLGIVYQRLSYRSLTGATAAVPMEAVAEPQPRGGGRGRRGRRHGRSGRRPEAPAHEVSRGRGGHRPPSHGAPAHAATAAHVHAPVAGNGGPHTAPHDELLAVVRELSERAPGHHVTLDALANALKQRGFSRPPGSPRLITRLRRIKELEVSRSGVISLIGVAAPMAVAEPVEEEQPRDRKFQQPVEEEQADDVDGNVAPPELTPAAAPERSSGRRRRSRRGGRRHRRRGAAAPAAEGA